MTRRVAALDEAALLESLDDPGGRELPVSEPTFPIRLHAADRRQTL